MEEKQLEQLRIRTEIIHTIGLIFKSINPNHYLTVLLGSFDDTVTDEELLRELIMYISDNRVLK